MERFNVSKFAKHCAKLQIELQDNNGWIDAYKTVPGEQAYRDGIYLGVNNAYIEAVYDIEKYILSLLNENPYLKASKLIDLLSTPVKKK